MCSFKAKYGHQSIEKTHKQQATDCAQWRLDALQNFVFTFGEAFGDARSRSETFSTRRACFGGAVRLRPFILLSSSPNTSPVLSAEIKSSNSPLLSVALLFLLFFFSGTGWLLWMSFLAADLWRSRSFCWKVKHNPLRLVSRDARAIADSACDWMKSLGNQQKDVDQWFSVLV